MSKNKIRGVGKTIADITGFPICTGGALPVFQMISDRELIIEGVTGIDFYDEACVKTETGKMNICICGCNLVIKFMCNNNIAVCGTISEIQIEHKKGEKRHYI